MDRWRPAFGSRLCHLPGSRRVVWFGTDREFVATTQMLPVGIVGNSSDSNSFAPSIKTPPDSLAEQSWTFVYQHRQPLESGSGLGNNITTPGRRHSGRCSWDRPLVFSWACRCPGYKDRVAHLQPAEASSGMQTPSAASVRLRHFGLVHIGSYGRGSKS